jgi:hypothetical protein
VGARCQVMPGARRGVVMFVGPIEQIKPGHWVSLFPRLPSLESRTSTNI